MSPETNTDWVPPARRRIILMRHGEVKYFDARGAHHPDDVLLTTEGEAQARAAAATLAEVRIDRAFTSGLPRTEATLRLVLAGRDVPVETEPRLREIETGPLELWATASPGQVRTALLDALPCDLLPETPFLGGETFASVIARVESAWQALLARQDWRSALIVAHGVVNRLLLCRLLDAGLGAIGILEQDPGCLNILDIDAAGGVLVRLVNHTPANPTKRGIERSTMEGLYHDYLTIRAARRAAQPTRTDP